MQEFIVFVRSSKVAERTAVDVVSAETKKQARDKAANRYPGRWVSVVVVADAWFKNPVDNLCLSDASPVPECFRLTASSVLAARGVASAFAVFVRYSETRSEVVKTLLSCLHVGKGQGYTLSV